MTRKILTALTAAAGLALAASQAHATVFTLDSFDVIAHADDPGLVVQIDKIQTTPLTFDLGAINPQTFDLFVIYTDEDTVNPGEDTTQYPIELDLNFSAPTPNSTDPITGDTYGYSAFFGLFQGGVLNWDTGTSELHFGNGLTGLMTITVNGGTFNDGIGGTDQACTHFRRTTTCDPESKGLVVSATFDWDHDPTGGVPEPASWALMISGFGMAGAALRRRRALTA